MTVCPTRVHGFHSKGGAPHATDAPCPVSYPGLPPCPMPLPWCGEAMARGERPPTPKAGARPCLSWLGGDPWPTTVSTDTRNGTLLCVSNLSSPLCFMFSKLRAKQKLHPTSYRLATATSRLRGARREAARPGRAGPGAPGGGRAAQGRPAAAILYYTTLYYSILFYYIL